MTVPGVVFVPGSRWDDVMGTDRQLANALAEHVPVLWVDPGYPLRLPTADGAGWQRDRLDQVSSGLTRLRFVVPPGASRPGGREVAAWCRAAATRRAVRQLSHTVRGVVLSSPQARFPSGVAGRRLLLVTDDWCAGAAMMGLSRTRIESVLDANLRDADEVAAVSPALGEQLGRRSQGRVVALVPNGCAAPASRPPTSGRSGAVLLGQLNERLDLDAVEAVIRAGVPVTVIGPRTEREPTTVARLDTLLSSPGVTWLGQRPHGEVAALLDGARLGLTPYLDNAFNRSSFPLKTLEYLGAGLPVVSSDLPSTRWLSTDLIEVARGPEAFGARAARLANLPWDDGAARLRTDLAASHTWSARAESVLSLLGQRSRAGGPAASRHRPSRS